MHGWLRVALAAAVVCTAALVEAAHRYANCAVQLAEVAARGFDVALWEPLTECQLLHPPSFTRSLIAASTLTRSETPNIKVQAKVDEPVFVEITHPSLSYYNKTAL